MGSNKRHISTSKNSPLWITALLFSLASTQNVKAQDYEEFTTNDQVIKDKTSYILKDENGWYMKAGYDATNRLRLMSTRSKNEATPFFFSNWYSDYYFITVQMEGDSKCYLARNMYDTPIFELGYIRDTEYYGWDCSSGCMSLSSIHHGWTTDYYLYCTEGEWDFNTSKMSTITMLEVDAKQDKGKSAGGSSYSGIEELEDESQNHPIYTISGTKVRGKPLNHGIYIIDGHKIAY